MRQLSFDDSLEVEYRLVDGRLFRPLLAHGHDRASTAPTVFLTESWNPLDSTSRSFNPGLFRRVPIAVPLSGEERKRNRRITMDFRDDAERRAEDASSDLAVIDGVVHHATRAPTWALKTAHSSAVPILPAVPDFDDLDADALVDCRVDPFAVVEELAGRFPFGPARGPGLVGSIEVLEPSLIPSTARDEAVQAAAARVHDVLATKALAYVNPSTLRSALELFAAARPVSDAAERALSELASMQTDEDALRDDPESREAVDAKVSDAAGSRTPSCWLPPRSRPTRRPRRTTWFPENPGKRPAPGTGSPARTAASVPPARAS